MKFRATSKKEMFCAFEPCGKMTSNIYQDDAWKYMACDMDCALAVQKEHAKIPDEVKREIWPDWRG